MPIKRIKQFNEKHAPRGSFRASVLTLMTGTVIAQAIPIAAAPILTRLYTPADFGVFALYLSVTALIGVIATARYELAIMLPEKDEDAVNLVALSVLIAVAVSVVTLLVVWIFNAPITKLLGNPAVSPWLYFVPLSVLLTGVFQALNYWSNRKKQYGRLAARQVIQSGVMIATQTGLGVLRAGAGGMVAGRIAGQAVATGMFIGNVIKEDHGHFHGISVQKMLHQMLRQYKFPAFSLPSSFINVASQQAPVVLLTFFFGPAVVGLFALTQRVIGIPLAFFSTSIQGVFRERASKDFNESGNCQGIYKKTLKVLFLCGLLPTIVVVTAAPGLFSFVFGPQWKVAGEYAQILGVMFFIQFLASTLSYVLDIAGKQDYEFIWNILLFLSTVVSIAIGGFLHDPQASFISYSIAYSVMYLGYLFISLKASKGKVNGHS